MGSALLDTTLEAAPAEAAGKLPPAAESLTARATAAQPVGGLRSQVAERLAEHRSRRARMQAPPSAEPARLSSPDPRAARIAATVAARYAQQQSYRAFLAAEAERAIQQAQAAAEVAALNAQAIATAQQRLLDAFDQSTAAQSSAPAGAPRQESSSEPRAEFPHHPPEELSLWPEAVSPPLAHRTHAHSGNASRRTAPKSAPAGDAAALPLPTAALSSGFTVRLYEDPGRGAPAPLATYTGTTARTNLQRANPQVDRNDREALALDEEIAFRQAPVFEESPGPPMALPANLIEFPRQLVASRKARPRYAEGPLRDADAAESADGQLRIFEVDAAQISTSPAPAADPEAEATQQWTAIWLDAPTVPSAQQAAGALPAGYASVYAPDSSLDADAKLPGVAPISSRLLAAGVNGAIVAAGVAAFAAAFVAVTRHDLPWQSLGSAHARLLELAGRTPAPAGLAPTMLLGALALAAGFLYVLYQALFFSLNTATPGMRCARIALCTFDDDNPTRRATRRRALAVLLSAGPLGLGFLWTALDDDRLTWHDRLSRIYQRKY